MTFFNRHPGLTVTLVSLVLLLLLAIVAEIALRFIVPYNIGYYAAVKKPGLYQYPYGIIPINADGWPDEEFDLNSPKKRIGYFGDSVTFGVGVGYGYRFTDLLQEKHPQYEHWTFSMVANGIQDDSIVEMAEKYDLDTVIYAMNLNDILPAREPAQEGTERKPSFLESARFWFYTHLDQLRGKSYLYTATRTAFKNALTRMGYGHTGFRAVELFPEENKELIREVAERIDAVGQKLKAEKINFCVILLPYEMQISQDAARTYTDLGIHWEEGFTNGSTQKALRAYLRGFPVYDGMQAFEGLNPQVGDYFVYNKGDKIDFNHPNRAGHKLLAQGIEKQASCLF